MRIPVVHCFGVDRIPELEAEHRLPWLRQDSEGRPYLCWQTVLVDLVDREHTHVVPSNIFYRVGGRRWRLLPWHDQVSINGYILLPNTYKSHLVFLFRQCMQARYALILCSLGPTWGPAWADVDCIAVNSV